MGTRRKTATELPEHTTHAGTPTDTPAPTNPPTGDARWIDGARGADHLHSTLSTSQRRPHTARTSTRTAAHSAPAPPATPSTTHTAPPCGHPTRAKPPASPASTSGASSPATMRGPITSSSHRRTPGVVQAFEPMVKRRHPPLRTHGRTRPRPTSHGTGIDWAGPDDTPVPIHPETPCTVPGIPGRRCDKSDGHTGDHATSTRVTATPTAGTVPQHRVWSSAPSRSVRADMVRGRGSQRLHGVGPYGLRRVVTSVILILGRARPPPGERPPHMKLQTCRRHPRAGRFLATCSGCTQEIHDNADPQPDHGTRHPRPGDTPRLHTTQITDATRTPPAT
jgi:hypothetical protein